MTLTPLALNKLEDSATGRALDAVLNGQAVLENFVDFSTGLVRNVFRTIVESTMDQLEAYAELVANVSGSLDAYETRSFPNLTADTGDVVGYINNYIKPSFGASTWTAAITKVTTAGVSVYTPASPGVELDLTKYTDFLAHFAGVTASYSVAGVTADHAIAEAVVSTLNAQGVATKRTILVDLLYAFTLAKFRKEVHAAYDKLVTILKLGMQKVVVTDGRISSRLTFHVAGADTDAIQSSQTASTYTLTTSNVGGGLSGSLFSRALGFNLGGSRRRTTSTLNVSVVNEQKTAVTSLDVDITAAVDLNFRTDYFPSFDPAATP